MRQSSNIVHLDEKRSRTFLHDLAHHNFITVVFDGETAKVYTKGIELDARALRTIKDTLNNIEQGE